MDVFLLLLYMHAGSLLLGRLIPGIKMYAYTNEHTPEGEMVPSAYF